MNIELHINWKIVVLLPENMSINKLFNFRTGKSFLRQIGGIEKSSFEPKTLEPTNVFHDAFMKKRENLGFGSRKFPYTCIDNMLVPFERINFNIRLFSSRVLVMSVIPSPISLVAKNIDFEKIQDLKRYSNLYELVLTMIGLMVSGKHRGYQKASHPKIFPCMAICYNDPGSTISDKYAVSILTRHSNVNNRIVDSVILKNSNHQLDDESSLLIDRQGVFSRIPLKPQQYKDIIRKYKSVCCMHELAAAIAKISQVVDVSTLSSDEKKSIHALISAPDKIFINSVTAINAWTLLLSEFNLQNYSELFADDESKKNFDDRINVSKKKREWSEGRKWIMGIVSLIFIGILSWLGKNISTKINIFKPDSVSLISPLDGEVFKVVPYIVDLKWQSLENAVNYIVFIEEQNLNDGKWQPKKIPNRYVTRETKITIEIEKFQQYRWKVNAENSNQKIVGKSDWRYMVFLK